MASSETSSPSSPNSAPNSELLCSTNTPGEIPKGSGAEPPHPHGKPERRQGQLLDRTAFLQTDRETIRRAQHQPLFCGARAEEQRKKLLFPPGSPKAGPGYGPTVSSGRVSPGSANRAYDKEDSGNILLGAFEANAKPSGVPEDFDHFEPILEKAVARMSLPAEAGIHIFFNGPESFTPDDRYYLGEAPELRGLRRATIPSASPLGLCGQDRQGRFHRPRVGAAEAQGRAYARPHPVPAA